MKIDMLHELWVWIEEGNLEVPDKDPIQQYSDFKIWFTMMLDYMTKYGKRKFILLGKECGYLVEK